MALNIVSSERLSTNVKTSNLGTELKKKVGQSKNLVINGAMQVAQRGTSSTTNNGYYTIDRIKQYYQDLDEAPTISQSDVASGTTPYTLGFRKALKVTNGNQTSGAGVSDQIQIIYWIEAQDIANSGWNYKSSSSFLTFSFWIKSSVAQVFNFYVITSDGTEKNMPFSTPSLSADTWTKVEVQIKGDSGIDFNNDNGHGLGLYLAPYLGTNYTDNSLTNGEWATYSSATRYKDLATTWFTTNDATVEYTGLQLEVGSVATDFEHECYQKQLYRCYRYYVERGFESLLGSKSGAVGYPRVNFPVVMRAVASTVIKYDGTDGAMRNQNDGSKITGFSTYNHYDYGFASRGSNGSPDIIHSSTYYADAEL